ncbi:eCIS core domain-containing protein [Kibdelosporangium aridum]|uniref:eCIS core domain-containing protein n=1 Tax=Kibdelosporangium aridum TaxID=2030 RepID=A0A1W1ZGN7_KIBAR|nr:DUF4157 domain-containing protein [Kibdelosporangium aridum]SMC47639.1 protein of unknown function [Kibdelosporangium aridum]
MKTAAAPRQQASRKREADSTRVVRPPEFKDIVSGAGQPLDVGLRRELEERLGHDFSQVRIHADRDAAALTALLGAEAVAVGKDVFFAEGAFHPETVAGRALLTHELLHTVQVPYAPGPLRLGRSHGALSDPRSAVELEASDGSAAEVDARGAQVASWLRFTRVSADQQRAERLDPATIVDRLVAGVLRSLRGDPTDASGRVRLQFGRLAVSLRELVLDRLETRLSSAEFSRVLELVAEADAAAAGGSVESAAVPEPVTDTVDEIEASRDAESESREGQEEQDEQREEDEKAAEEEPPVEEEPSEPSEPEEPTEEEPSEEEKEKEKEEEDEEKKDKEKEDEESKDEDEKSKDKSKDKEGEKPAEEQARDAEAAAAAQPAAQAPGAMGAMQPMMGQGPAAGATPVGGATTADAQPGAERPERVEAAAMAPDSPLVRHGLVDRPDKDTVEEAERPIGLEPDAEAEIATPEPEPERAAAEPERPELKPEDFLPGSDLDVSNVPTAAQVTLPAGGAAPRPPAPPSFPAPPPTKAEQEEAEEPPAPAAPEAAEPEPSPEPATAEPELAEPERAAAEPAEPAETGPDPEPLAGPAEPQPLAAQPAAEPAGPGMGPAGPGADLGGPGVGPAGPGADLGGPGASPGGPGADFGGPEAGAAGPGAGLDGPGMGSAGPGADAGLAGPPGAGPDASLEAGGGACAGSPEPTTDGAKPEGGQGGCAAGGGGGAAPPAAEQQPPAPDVSAQQPEAALATVSTLPPDRMASSLSQVDSAVGKDVGDQQAQLQAAPPTAQRPSGAPQTLSGPPEAAPLGHTEKVTLDKIAAERAEQQKQQQAKQVQGTDPAGQASRPQVTGGTDGKITEQEARNVEEAVENVPTTDPALHATVGPVQKVELKGETDPVRTDEQSAELSQKSQEINQGGKEEAAKPLGEDQIYPNVPAETLTAEVPGGQGGGGGPVGPGAAAADQGVAVVAQQERGPQIQAGVAQGQAQMGQERQNQQQGAAEANAQHEADVAQAVQENAEAQAAERGKVAEDAAAQREEWRAEQDKKIQETGAEAGKEHEQARTGIHKEKTDADREGEERQKQDNDEIAREREAAEEKARKEKERKKEESSGGIFGWIASKVKSFFEGLLNAITAIFDAAIKLVNTIVQGFASFITGLIDLARNAIIGLINALADALLKLCDILAIFFPELAAKIRAKIEQLRDAAIAAVNALADALKAGVQALMNLLAQALTGLLRLLEAGLKAAVQVVRAAVEGAIEFARAAIQMLGQFAAIIADIAAMGVGPWLGRLGSSAKEGIQNHLWGAIKAAVRQWFNEKVESILGLGKAVINTLVKGCISMAKIGRMAWDALIASLPMIIIMVVIERLVSLIIPAAGAVLAIVQGLMAAWGTISRILAAIGAFIAFLKAVRAGPAACLFATAVAAGVVALLEFITNFLMAKLAMAAKGVGRTLSGMAKKIQAGLRRTARGPRKATGTAVNSARRDLKSALAPPRRPAMGAGPGTARRPGALARRPGAAAPTRRPRPAAGPGRRARPERPAPARRRDRDPDAPRRPGDRDADARSRDRDTPSPGRARRAVRAVGNVLRKAGRKIANSRLGRALRNSVNKLRDKFRRRRDHTKDRQRQRAADRRRRNDQQSPQAKQRRLELIVARIRPRLERLLSRGVRGPVLRVILQALRVWHRLTSLELLGTDRFRIRATLNPGTVVVAGVEINEERLLRFIRQVADEILTAPTTIRQAAKVKTDLQSRVVNQSGKTEVIPVYRPARRTSLPALLRFLKDLPYRRSGHEVISLSGGVEVWRQQGWLPTKGLPPTVNKKVFAMLDGMRQSGRPPSYLEIAETIKEDARGSKFRAKRLARQVQRVMRGKPVTGSGSDLAGFLGILTVVQEGHRDPRSAPIVTTAMAMQIMAKTGDVDKSLGNFPAAPVGSQRGMFRLSDYLEREERGDVLRSGVGEPLGPGGESTELQNLSSRATGAMAAMRQVQRDEGSAENSGQVEQDLRRAEALRKATRQRSEHMARAQEVMDREIKIIQIWAETLDLKVLIANEEDRTQALFRLIRQRMHAAYNIPVAETAAQSAGGELP